MIALPKYILQVPANLIGHGQFSAAKLETIQEVIPLTLIALGAGFVFKPF